MLHRERDRVKRVIEIGKSLPLDNTEAVGHWGRYACIASTGYIEIALRLIIQEHVKLKATTEISTYITKSTESIQNPKCEKLIKVIRGFSDTWGSKLEDYFTKNPEAKNAIDSLMTNRHLIAHGRQYTISLGTVSKYFEKADDAMNYINELINPPKTP